MLNATIVTKKVTYKERTNDLFGIILIILRHEKIKTIKTKYHATWPNEIIIALKERPYTIGGGTGDKDTYTDLAKIPTGPGKLIMFLPIDSSDDV
jgi:hypothetical protein